MNTSPTSDPGGSPGADVWQNEGAADNPVQDESADWPDPEATDVTGDGSAFDDAEAPVWYLALSDGREDGPLPLSAVAARIQSGEVTAGDIVWRDGLPDWVAAGTVAELMPYFPAPAAPYPPPPQAGAPYPPPPGTSAPPRPQPMQRSNASQFWEFEKVFANPYVYRITSRVCGGIGGFLFFISVPLWFFDLSWFTGAIIFMAACLFCQATAVLLEKLAAIEKKLASNLSDKPDPQN